MNVDIAVKKLILGSILAIALEAPAYATESCIGLSNAIVVDTSLHSLRACQDNRTVKEYRISIGRGGIDKRKQGDRKTPLGEYSLGKPRPSNRFTLFIPIEYPTKEQQAMGYTGADVGIHGPHRLFALQGSINRWFDWTLGCIALGSNDAIAEISDWITQHGTSRIIIR
jgi:hypothetical protein